MKQLMKLALAAATGAVAAGSVVYAQAAPAGPPEAIVSIYQAAPGHQQALLTWMAERDRIAAAAGLPAGQLYIHTNGASWDYVTINPVTTAAQDAAMDAAARQMGLATGPRVGLELRKHIATHSDTYTVGPVTAAQALATLGG